MNPIFMIIGSPAVGKSTTSRALAAHFQKSIHIPVDMVREMVVAGLVIPGAEWSDALVQQISLARDTASHMALTYREAGFTVVIDDFWSPDGMADYEALLRAPSLWKVILWPQQEEAHRRNHQRSGGGSFRDYIDQGINFVYGLLENSRPQLSQQGWIIMDTTALTPDETVAAILRRTTG